MRIARTQIDGAPVFGIVEDETFHAISGHPFTTDGRPPTRTGKCLEISSIKLLSPVAPRRVLVILGGFLADGHDRVPEGMQQPRLFPKVVTGHLGPDDTIPRPAVLTGSVEMEAELALVVGKHVHRVSPQDAWSSILGFTTYNDVTAAEFVPDDLYRAKSLDGFSVLGPWVCTDITEDHVRDGLMITGRVNGVTCQSGNTARFKFDPGQVLSFASQYVTLLPGDVIALGTPPPPYPIEPGDVVEVEVDRIGTLTNVAG